MSVENKDLTLQEIKRIGKLTGDGVFIYHIANACLLYVNPVLVKILEINKKLLIEEPSLIVGSIPEEDREYLRMRIVELEEKGVLEDLQVRISRSRTEKFLLCNAYRTTDQSAIIGFVRDISHARRHEEYLVNFGARKDAILDMVSQNLTTPLNLSRFTLELVEKAVQEKKYHKLTTHIGVMREVTAECIRIIDRFLQEEHLASPKVNPKRNRFDVIEKIFIVLEKLKASHPDKQLRFKSDVKQLFIVADDLKFFQIVHNLLSNSIKFTRPKGLIEVAVKDHNSTVEVTVKDDGIGIPEEFKSFVFDKKTRAARPGLNGEISNGIGLYVVQELTRMLKGKISFESKPTKGTKFTLILPKE